MVKQACEPEKYPMHQTYIDLIESLNDFQILYLDGLNKNGIDPKLYKELINPIKYGVSEDDIEFYLFDLEYRGLIMNEVDIKSNTIKASKKLYIITRRAQYFLQFIEELIINTDSNK